MKDFNKALNYSFLLLKYRARSRGEITSRLKRKECSPAVRKKVVDYLEENNYINDEKFAHLYFSYSLEKGWGPVRIDFNLKRLGISPQLRKQVLGEDSVYNDKVREIIERKLEHYKKRKPSFPPAAIWQKIVMHLVRKGFNYKIINQEMDSLGVNPVRERGSSNGVNRFEDE